MNDIKKTPILSAPLQGITTHVWRKAHHEVFAGVDSYYTPFIRMERGAIMSRDLRDVDPAMNTDVPVIPQILACKPQEAIAMVTHLKSVGYKQIDINLGCPHPPIALKHKGSGMLAYPQEVEALFDALAQETDVTYSIKMRLGWDSPTQWRDVTHAFNIIKPIHITIHPRIGRQQYKGEVHINEFEQFVEQVGFPIIYNGDIASMSEVNHIVQRYGKRIAGVMVGRGLISDPAFASPGLASVENYRRFHGIIYNAYNELLNGGDHVILSRMKALWNYFLPTADRRSRKAIMKANNCSKYEIAVEELFAKLEIT